MSQTMVGLVFFLTLKGILNLKKGNIFEKSNEFFSIWY